jgi:hypothetical protein
MWRNCILVFVLFSGASLSAQQQASVKVVESTGPAGEVIKGIGMGIDKTSVATDLPELAPAPCSAVTSDGKAAKKYIAVFTSPCNIENSLIFQNANKVGTIINLSEGLYVNGSKLRWVPTGIAGCSNSQANLGTITFGANDSCTGFALGSDGTNTFLSAPSGGMIEVFGNLNAKGNGNFLGIGSFVDGLQVLNSQGGNNLFQVDNHGNIGAAGGLTTSGSSTINGNLEVVGSLSAVGIYSSQNSTINGNLEVTGSLSVGGNKNFKIDDPLDPANKYMYHASVESSEVMNIYTGNATTDTAGNAVVQLPAWFEVLNGDFRYQLTVIGQFAQAIVASKVANHNFGIKTDKPNVEVSWQVTGLRQDAYTKAHPLVVEEEKPAAERGHYLHPEVFGQPESKAIRYAYKSPVREKQPESAKTERSGD